MTRNSQGFIAIAISKPGSANATTECDLRLVSKDGAPGPGEETVAAHGGPAGRPRSCIGLPGTYRLSLCVAMPQRPCLSP